MFRRNAALAVAAALAGALASSIAVAQADSSTGSTGATGATGTTSSTAATIMVNGAATATLDTSSSSATISAAYLTALGNALTDAHTKAVALAAAVGDTLGPVQNITEQSNDAGLCSGPILFNAAGSAKGAPVPAGKPTTRKHKHHSARAAVPIVRVADVTPTTCSFEADVTVTYTMAPA
jgi:hypothetical protein